MCNRLSWGRTLALASLGYTTLSQTPLIKQSETGKLIETHWEFIIWSVNDPLFPTGTPSPYQACGPAIARPFLVPCYGRF